MSEVIAATTNQPDQARDQSASMGLLLKEVLDQRDSSILADFRKEILALAKPDRSNLPEIVSHTDRGGDVPIVSYRQPTDRLYARLYRIEPELRSYRTPDLDHWGKEWLCGLLYRDRVRMAVAKDRMDSINLRQMRATTLEGTLDASDPTAILSGTGGHLLPQNMANVVMIARDKAAVLPGICLNYVMTAKTLRIPTAGAVTAAMAAEGATASQGEPAFATELLDAEKCQAYMKASVEMLQDSPFNLISIYAERAGSAIGALEDVQICTTNGTSPNISEAIAGGNVDEATTTVLIYEDLVKLFFALGKPYRPTSVWLGSSATLSLMSRLMDGNDQPVLKLPSAQAQPVGDTPGAMGTVFGKPVYEVPLADGTLIFGDPKGYAFGRRSGIEASVSEHVDFASDLVNFKFTERFDGRIVDDVALKQMAALATVA